MATVWRASRIGRAARAATPVASSDVAYGLAAPAATPIAAALTPKTTMTATVRLPYTSDRASLATLLASSDLFVAPGGVETFGLAALEALASGTPVLSADRGGVAEQVIRSGAGALFRDGDAGALATAAERLLRSDLRALRQRARRHAENEHDWELTFGRLFDLYERVRA